MSKQVDEALAQIAQSMLSVETRSNGMISAMYVALGAILTRGMWHDAVSDFIPPEEWTPEEYAAHACDIAEAMMRERNSRSKKASKKAKATP